MIVGRYDDAARGAERALEVAVAANLPLVEGHARNTLGYSLAMTGDVDEGAAELREAIRIAREHDSPSDLAEGYDNYADMLHVSRPLGGRRATSSPRAAGRSTGRRPAAMTWLDLKLAEIAFDVGEWELSETVLPPEQPWTGTQTRVGIGLRRAALAGGRGDHAAADGAAGPSSSRWPRIRASRRSSARSRSSWPSCGAARATSRRHARPSTRGSTRIACRERRRDPACRPWPPRA